MTFKGRYFKRVLCSLLTAGILCVGCPGCSLGGGSVKGKGQSIPLSGISDTTDKKASLTYEMTAEYEDTYLFSSDDLQSITVEDESGNSSWEAENDLSVDLTAGQTVRITVTTAQPNRDFKLTVTPQNHSQRLPYEPRYSVDASTLDTEGDPNVDPLTPAKIEYKKREGGTYIFANNPEMLDTKDIGQALLKNDGLTGDVEFTYEHSNSTGRPLYLGYQLLNPGEEDVYVTVTNIGMQTDGEWLGQQSWSQWYNRSFELPDDYFDENGRVALAYQGVDFTKYSPRVFQPITYRLPAGEVFYVLGGTAEDAYRRISVDGTADRIIHPGRCSNGVVKFRVSGGTVNGTFYCYTKVDQVAARPAEQGYICQRGDTQYGLAYKGMEQCQGLIESDITWTVNDKTPSGDLPVTYESTYDPTSAVRNTDPYAAYGHEITRTREEKEWITHINPQNNHFGVGTDMINYTCKTPEGEQVIIDNHHADGTGQRANTGNWMVDYQDHFTLVNQGDTARTFTFRKRANGALMTMTIDSDGTELLNKCTVGHFDGSSTDANYKLATVQVAPHSVRQVTVSYLLMGNSYGNVVHSVTLD